MIDRMDHPENQPDGEMLPKTPMVVPSDAPPIAPVLLCAMGVFFLVVNVAMLTGIRLTPVIGGLALGVAAAETTLLAVFAALTPLSLFARVTASAAGMTLVCVAVYHAGGTTREERLVFAGVTALQWIAVQIPLWMFRLRGGWCLHRTSAAGSGARVQDLQFGIRQLLAWTVVVAVVLSIAKTAISAGSLTPGRLDALGTILATLIFVVFNSLAAWPIIWAAFVRSRMLAWCGVAVGCSAILCVGEIWTFRTLFGPGLVYAAVVVLHAIQTLATGGSLLLVRACGLRLTRAGDDEATTDTNDPDSGDSE